MNAAALLRNRRPVESVGDRELILLLNDRLTIAKRARIAALDRGFLYGDGLFETVRTYHGTSFALDRHLSRMARSARFFGIPFERSSAYWEPRIHRLLRANRLLGEDAAVRLTISRGAAPFGIVPPAGIKPTRLLLATRLDPRLAAAQARGVAACFFPLPLMTTALPGHKTLHYLPAVLGKMIAARKNAWESIYLASDDTVLEGSTSNVFVIRRGTLLTPPLGGILPGVTRRLLTAIARRTDLRTVEEPITRSELLAADEVFLTASTIEVLPVVRVENTLINNGAPGPRTRLLHTLYRQYVSASLRRRKLSPQLRS